MKRKKSKLQNNCGRNGFACSILFFIGLIGLVLLNYGCSSEGEEPGVLPYVIPDIVYEIPDMVTDLGIRVWFDEQDLTVDSDEIDEYFLKVVDELGYGPVPVIGLIISQTSCQEYPDGLVYCGFTDPSYPDRILAGLYFYLEGIIKIHLMTGEEIDPEEQEQWTLEQSAFSHEIEHHVLYWYGDDDWSVNDAQNTPAKGD